MTARAPTPRTVVIAVLRLLAVLDRDRIEMEAVSGKGAYMRALARDIALSLGTVGLQAHDYVACGFDRADVVICIGYDMIEWPPDRWNIGRQKRIVHIDFLPAEVDENYRVEVEIVGDLAHTLWMLNERMKSHRGEMSFDFSIQQAARRDMQARPGCRRTGCPRG